MFLNLALDGTSSPTLFELSMASGLTNSLRPGFEYFLQVFAERGNEWAIKASPRKHEIFGLLMLGIERHYLASYEGSFEENFYGLKRTTVTGKQLRSSQKLTSLLELCVIPYLRFGISPKFPWTKHIWSVYELATVFFQIGYLFQKTKFYTPLLWIQSVTIGRLTGEDMKKFNEKALQETVTFSSNKVKFLLQKLTLVLRVSIILSAVLFKVFEYYYSPQNRAAREAQQQRRFGPTLVPPPPMPSIPLNDSKRLIIDPVLCPLCGEVRTNPALSSSGYCFCYKCIQKYVQEHAKCPITGTPCTPLEIRRIFAT